MRRRRANPPRKTPKGVRRPKRVKNLTLHWSTLLTTGERTDRPKRASRPKKALSASGPRWNRTHRRRSRPPYNKPKKVKVSKGAENSTLHRPTLLATTRPRETRAVPRRFRSLVGG